MYVWGSYIVQESLRDSALSKKWKACPVKASKILELHGQVIMYAEVNTKSDLEIKHSSVYAPYKRIKYKNIIIHIKIHTEYVQ